MSLFLLNFALQIIFAIFRTINVVFTAKQHTAGSVISGTIVSLLWVLTTKFGIDAYNDGWMPMIGYICGASAGIFVGMILSKKIKNNTTTTQK